MADSFFSAVCSCALKQLGLEGLERVKDWLGDHLSDQGRRVTNALRESNEKAWKAVEIVLAGETLWNRLDRAEERAFRQQLAAFLKQLPMPEPAAMQPYRQKILQDIRDAKKKALLFGRLVPEDLAARVGPMADRTNPQRVLEAEKRALVDMTAEVKQAGLEALAWLLEQQPQPGQSIVIVSVRYYFRRAVEKDDELARGLQFEQMENLSESQRKGFEELDAGLKAHAARVEEVMAGLAEVMGELRDATLDLRSEMEKMRGENKELYAKVLRMLEQQEMHLRPVRAGDSLTIRSDLERRKVKDFLAHYRSMPEDEKRAAPALLNGLGKLQVATGDYENAQEAFTRVAEMAPDAAARAEGHYNAYHAALERAATGDGSYAVALAELKMALRYDPERFAPFPPDDYEPQRILGAGGFGVTFQCRKRLTGTDVAVKALQADGLERDVNSVLQEASTLDQLAHPAIIRLRHCGYADPRTRTRPFIEMDYFEATTLEEYVQKNGPLPVGKLLALAKPVAEALHAAHGKGILHRDVKPANLLVRRTDAGWEVRVIDFGLALKSSLLGAAGSSSGRNRSMIGGDIAGTRHYAAPEQMGELPGVRVGTWSDVYGWAKTCCYALFQNTEPTYLDYKKVPEALGVLISQCLARMPNDRPSGFAEVLDKLAKIRAEAPKSKTIPPPPKQEPMQAIPLREPAIPVRPQAIPVGIPSKSHPPKSAPPRIPPQPRAPEVLPITALTGGGSPLPAAIPVAPRAKPAEVRPTPRSSPRLPSGRRTPRMRPRADAVKAPAIALIVLCLASVVIYGIITLFYLTMIFEEGPRPALLGMLVLILVFAAAAAFGAFCGFQMLRHKNFTLAIIGCCVVMLIGGCCIGLPIGIWGIIVLLRPDVKATFT